MKPAESKAALVTGGRKGIGKAIAQRLASDGFRVFTAQRGRDEQFECLDADWTQPDAAEKVIAWIIATSGRLDLLVNNAGVMHEGTVEEISLDDWQTTIAVNLTAPFLLAKHAMPYLKQGGVIVNVGSIEGIGSNPRHPAYAASKAGLHGLTRSLAIDHGPDGVRCNAVAPGWIDTELNNAFVEAMPDPKRFRREIGALHPVGRTGLPEDVAALVSYLASDQAAFMSGQILTIDGGRTAKLSLPQP